MPASLAFSKVVGTFHVPQPNGSWVREPGQGFMESPTDGGSGSSGTESAMAGQPAAWLRHVERACYFSPL
jgi:hypothetical protein